MPSRAEDAVFRLAHFELFADSYRSPERVAMSSSLIATIKRSTEARCAARKTAAAILRNARRRVRNPR
jgi:hypothetical protein